MEGCKIPLLLLLTAVVALTVLGGYAEAVHEDTVQVKNLTSELLHVIPHNINNSSVTKLVIKDSLITLNETDRQVLATYPQLVELHLDGNLVTSIPAKYFSVVPQLRVLSLSRNNISSLDPESLFGLAVLTKLDVSQNQLTFIPKNLFKGLNALQVLDLDGNPWNCSCPLLSVINDIIAIGTTVGGQVTCASPENQAGIDLLQATATCYPTPTPKLTTDQQKPVNSQQSLGSTTTLKTTLTSNQNQKIKDNKAVQTPVLGNTWKFTASVVALALTTSMLIVCGIKGPSLYKLFHNYRHRRLRQEEEEDNVSTVFSGTGRYMNHQTFNFGPEIGQLEEEEEEDVYYEDPYIRREE